MIDWMTALLGSIRENKEKMKSLRRGEVRVLMCVCVCIHVRACNVFISACAMHAHKT